MPAAAFLLNDGTKPADVRPRFDLVRGAFPDGLWSSAMERLLNDTTL